MTKMIQKDGTGMTAETLATFQDAFENAMGLQLAFGCYASPKNGGLRAAKMIIETAAGFTLGFVWAAQDSAGRWTLGRPNLDIADAVAAINELA